jgi:hypothetical protein
VGQAVVVAAVTEMERLKLDAGRVIRAVEEGEALTDDVAALLVAPASEAVDADNAAVLMSTMQIAIELEIEAVMAAARRKGQHHCSAV